MQWPPQSPDFNPIEKLWDEMDRKVKIKCPNSEKQLCTYLESAWNEIQEETLKKIVARLPRIVKSVIAQ